MQAKYSDGSTKNVTGYTCSASKLLNAGTNKITVSYTENGVTRTDSFSVSVSVKKYIVTISGGTGITSVSGGGSYAPGEKVTVKATVSSGYSFSKWTSSNTSLVSDYTGSSYTFTMPSSDVALVANATKSVVYATSLSLNSTSGKLYKKVTGVSVSSINTTVGYIISTPSVTPEYETVSSLSFTATVNSDADDKTVSVDVSAPSASADGVTADISVSKSRSGSKTTITVKVNTWPTIGEVYYDITVSANGASSNLEKKFSLTIQGVSLNTMAFMVKTVTPDNSKIIKYDDGKLAAVDNGTSYLKIETWSGHQTTVTVHIDCPDYYDVSTSSKGKYIRTGPGQSYSYDLYTDISPGARVYIDDVYYNTSEKRVYGHMRSSYTDPDDGSVASAGWFEMYYFG